MKIKNQKVIVMQSMSEAFNIWIRPQDFDYRGGGQKAVQYAAWDYLGLDPNVNPNARGIELKGETNEIQALYDKLCDDPRDQLTDEFEYDFETGEHNFPENFPLIKLLDAYRAEPDRFKLDFCEDATDLFMELHNLKNDKKFRVSAVSDNGYVREVFFVLLNRYDFIKSKETEKLAEDPLGLVADFLAD